MPLQPLAAWTRERWSLVARRYLDAASAAVTEMGGHFAKKLGDGLMASEALEGRFADVADHRPELVARHCTEAGLIEKGINYWLRAGRNAAARYANLEAIAHLQRGIEALERLPSALRDRLDLDMQLALGPCVIAAQGPGSTLAAATFARARQVCERLGDPPEYLHVMHWLIVAHAVRGQLPEAREASITLVGLAEGRGDRPALINAVRGADLVSLLMGQDC